MTGKEIRSTDFLKWKDPWAWMETMKGKRWENLIKREKAHFNELALQPYVEKLTKKMEKEIRDAHQYISLNSFKVGCGTIDITYNPTSRFEWKWTWLKKGIPAYDLDVQGNIVWYVTSNEDKKYKNRLICEDSTGKKIWTKNAVSSQIAVINDMCYYIKVVEYFKTVELCVCDAQTGRNEHILYKEENEERDLSLCKTANKTLYLKSEDPQSSSLYRIDHLKLIPLYKNSVMQMPLGESVYGNDCVLTRQHRDDDWVQHGKPVHKWILPKEDIQWINLQSGHVLTINEGAQTIWYCAEYTKPHPLFKIKVGLIDVNVWAKWENSLIQSFTIKCPFEVPYMIHIINNKVVRDTTPHKIHRPITFAPLDVHRYHVESKDTTKVPYIVIKEKGQHIKAQLIYVYGAYGSTTPVNWPYQNWYPLLQRGWAVVFAMVRGGGDIDAAWADAARVENRHVSIEDFEAVIRDARKKNKLTADKTVIYGRSAGGLPVGAIVSRFPDGQLVGAAFTEVPYVDVLRTSSNPDLPLTIGEYKEFGNPSKKLLDFKELLNVSPINTLPNSGAPGVFVISRTGLLDVQVYAYESFKWIQKLRGAASPDESDMVHPKGKYVTVEREEAHQYSVQRFPRFRAIDLAILDAWIDGKLKM
jgi:hypothetical protein